MDFNKRPTSTHTTPQPVIVQYGVHQFHPVTQAQVVLLQHPTNGQYQLHLIVPASVDIIHYHTSRKCLRDGYFDIEVAPIPGRPGVHGLKVCLGWDVTLQIKHPQQQPPGNFASTSGRNQAVRQTAVQTVPQAHRGLPSQAPAMETSSRHMIMPTSQATPTSSGGSNTVNDSVLDRGNGQSDFMYRQPSIAPPRPVKGGAGQQAMRTGLFSTPPFPGHPYMPTPPVPMPSASKAGGQFHGNRPDPRLQQRQYSTGRPTQSTPTPAAPHTGRHARTAVPTPSHTNLGQNLHGIANANCVPADTSSVPFENTLQTTFPPQKQPAIDLTRSSGKTRFSPATPTKVAKSSPHHSSTKRKTEIHAKAFRAFDDLSSQRGSTAKVDEPSTFEPSEPFQDISTPQAPFIVNAGQQVIKMPSAPPSQSSSTPQGTSSTAQASTPAAGEDSRMPADDEMVPLGENDDLFGEGSDSGDDNDDDLDNGKHVNSELEGIESPSIKVDQLHVQEGDVQPDQIEAVDQNGQLHTGEAVLDGSASGSFTAGNDSTQDFDPTFDANDFDLDSNMEVFNPADLTPEEMISLFPGLFSPKNQNPYDG